MESRGCAIVGTLFGVSKTYGKLYCFPSQAHILRLLVRYHQISISRRTLNRDLSELEKEGYIVRLRRITEEGIKKGRFKSTLYKFTGKAVKYLYGLGKWVQGVLSFCRVPKMSHYESQTGNEILKQVANNVDYLLKNPFKGRASPI